MHQEEHVSLLKNPKVRSFVLIPLGISLALGVLAVYAIKLVRSELKTPDRIMDGNAVAQSRTLEVSDTGVDVPFPPDYLVSFYPEKEKSVLVRFLNGDEYELAAATDGKITITRDGKEVPDFGYNNPFGTISLHAKKGETVPVTVALSPKPK